jgi:hypothetical protein
VTRHMNPSTARALAFPLFAALSIATASNSSAQPAPAAPAPSPPGESPPPANELPAAANELPGAAPDAKPALPEASSEVPATSEKPKVDAAEEAANAAAEQVAAGADQDSNPQVEAYKLNLYGFADFTYTAQLTKTTFGDNPPSFYVGNLNLYADADLGESWHALAEVRFMYLPHGQVPFNSQYSPDATPADTTVGDYTDINRPVNWGGIAIQRVYLEYRFLSWLTARAGQFLTPYGIWNVDHGSPTIIGVHRPYIIGEALFPSQQTGLEFYGGGIVGPVELGYNLTLSNGRGPFDAYRDLDHNKAVGARLYARHRSELGTITLGASGYRGKYTNRATEISFSGADIVFNQPLRAQYDELSLAADLKWELEGFLLQSEVVTNEVAYTDSVRPPIQVPVTPPGKIPDNRRSGVYGITGYRFPFLGIMPWVGAEYYSMGRHSPAPDVAALLFGLNVRPTARVALKAEYSRAWFPNPATFAAPISTVNLLDLQAAWSF